GDTVLVMVKEIDDMGRTNLTRKKLYDQKERVIKEGFGKALEEEKAKETAIEAKAASAPRPAPGQRRGGSQERPDRRQGGPRR
ncbi:MAG: polyribonucleotide nucleotidyltransferase, partial [Aminobacterium colombiense]|nr:polyribonucleotide nucleotidyltransferase [Aminobacterium colombiense]